MPELQVVIMVFCTVGPAMLPLIQSQLSNARNKINCLNALLPTVSKIPAVSMSQSKETIRIILKTFLPNAPRPESIASPFQ